MADMLISPHSEGHDSINLSASAACPSNGFFGSTGQTAVCNFKLL